MPRTPDTFAARLAFLREKAGLSQVELAEAAGLPRSTVWRLEAGKVQPIHDTVVKLAEALGVKLGAFDLR